MKEINPAVSTKHIPIYWKILIWGLSGFVLIGIFFIIIGSSNMMNINALDATFEKMQLQEILGIGQITTGIAGILLGGIGVIVDVLVKTRINRM